MRKHVTTFEVPFMGRNGELRVTHRHTDEKPLAGVLSIDGFIEPLHGETLEEKFLTAVNAICGEMGWVRFDRRTVPASTAESDPGDPVP